MKIGKFKKIAAIGLALTMAIGLLYTSGTVNAEGSNESNWPIKTDALETNKTVEYDNTTQKYKIRLESYATGEVTTGERTPADIVLALDMSGSMNNYTDGSKSDSGKYIYNKIYADSLSKLNTYYVKDGRDYKEVSWSEPNNSWGYWYGRYWIKETPKSYDNDGNTQFYSREEKDKRIDALKEAVNAFIDNIANSNENVENKDRISIVKYAGQRSDWTGNIIDDEYFFGNGYQKTNRTQIVKELTSVDSTGVSSLKSLISQLEPAGQTRTDYGLEKAKDAVNISDDGRAKYIILFTDGEPSTFSDWSNDVAKKAISEAKSLKEDNVKIFTINVMNNADPSSDPNNPNTSKMDKFMHAVSSNYPNATTSEYGFNISFGIGNKNAGYYLVASDKKSLIDAFERIGESIGQSKIQLDEKAILADYISDSFKLPVADMAGNYNDIKVFTANYVDKDEWSDDYPLTGYTVHVNEQTRAITVSGFNYSDNYVLDNDPNNDNKPSGKKLIVEIYVDPIDGFIGGNGVEANTKKAGVYQNSVALNNNNPVENFDLPTIDVPIKYNPASKGVTKYLGNEWRNFETSITDNDGNFYSNNVNDKKIDTPYTIDGKRNKYVDIKYAIKDGDKTVATYTINAGETEGELKFNDPNFSTITLEECKTYSVEIVIKPIKEGRYESVSKNISPTLHVLVPKIDVNDSTIDYGTKTDLNNNVNKVGIAWKDITENHVQNGINIQGSEPTIQYSFVKVDKNTEKVEGNIYTPQKPISADFKLNPINSETHFDYSNYVYNGTINTNVFTVNVRTGKLSIIKKLDPTDYDGKDGSPIFTYKITVENQLLNMNEVFYRYIKLNDDSGNAMDAILDGLPVGTYTIEELDTLRFDFVKFERPSESDYADIIENNQKGKVKLSVEHFNNQDDYTVIAQYTNKEKSNEYDSDNDIIVNTFERTDDGVKIEQKFKSVTNE